MTPLTTTCSRREQHNLLSSHGDNCYTIDRGVLCLMGAARPPQRVHGDGCDTTEGGACCFRQEHRGLLIAHGDSYDTIDGSNVAPESRCEKRNLVSVHGHCCDTTCWRAILLSSSVQAGSPGREHWHDAWIAETIGAALARHRVGACHWHGEYKQDEYIRRLVLPAFRVTNKSTLRSSNMMLNEIYT